MRQSFGGNGKQGWYVDIDFADCLFMAGHKMAATQRVFWPRVLGRLLRPKPPNLVVIDCRHVPKLRNRQIHTLRCVMNRRMSTSPLTHFTCTSTRRREPDRADLSSSVSLEHGVLQGNTFCHRTYGEDARLGGGADPSWGNTSHSQVH